MAIKMVIEVYHEDEHKGEKIFFFPSYEIALRVICEWNEFRAREWSYIPVYCETIYSDILASIFHPDCIKYTREAA